MPSQLVGTLRRLAVALVLILGAAGLGAMLGSAKTGVIRGTVRDQAGAPIANAQVIIVGTRLASLTSDSGRYEFRNVPAGPVAVRAAFVGYKRSEVHLQLNQGDTVVVDIQLEQTPFQVEDITVIEVPPGVVPRDEVASRQAIAGYATGVNAFEQASVTAGASSAPFGNAQSGVVSTPGEHGREFDREQYARIYDNPFLAVGVNPLSTFSIDVDAASYSNIRRFLNLGQAPPKDAVRIEEMINYFTYDYQDPGSEHPFSVTTEMTDAPWNTHHKLVLIGLQGRRMPAQDLPPSNLVFLLDVSGSMDEPDKLPLVQAAFRLLVNQLRPQDRVAIVVYAGAAGLVLPSTAGSNKTEILDAIDRLEAGGSTAGGAGIQLAYQVAKENFIAKGNNRVILATDGDFNVGVSSDGDLVRLIEQKRTEGTFLTVLGFGTGNLQDAKMEQLADKGNGNYAYVDNLSEARKVFVHELGSTLFTIAKDVKIQVEFNPAQVTAYRLIGYENRLLRDEDFNDDSKDAGELGAGHAVTALYEVIPAGQPLDVTVRGIDSLKYQSTEVRPEASRSRDLLTVKLRYKQPDGETSRLLSATLDARANNPTENLRFASAVAAFGMILRESEFKGSADPDLVLRLARGAQGEDEQGYRAEFIRLVENYRMIKSPAVSQ